MIKEGCGIFNDWSKLRFTWLAFSFSFLRSFAILLFTSFSSMIKSNLTNSLSFVRRFCCESFLWFCIDSVGSKPETNGTPLILLKENILFLSSLMHDDWISLWLLLEDPSLKFSISFTVWYEPTTAYGTLISSADLTFDLSCNVYLLVLIFDIVLDW